MYVATCKLTRWAAILSLVASASSAMTSDTCCVTLVKVVVCCCRFWHLCSNIFSRLIEPEQKSNTTLTWNLHESIFWEKCLKITRFSEHKLWQLLQRKRNVLEIFHVLNTEDKMTIEHENIQNTASNIESKFNWNVQHGCSHFASKRLFRCSKNLLQMLVQLCFHDLRPSTLTLQQDDVIETSDVWNIFAKNSHFVFTDKLPQLLAQFVSFLKGRLQGRSSGFRG